MNKTKKALLDDCREYLVLAVGSAAGAGERETAARINAILVDLDIACEMCYTRKNARICAAGKQEVKIMNNFEIKKKIVLAGESEVFKNWQQLIPNITEEMFLTALKWACEDPAKDGEKLTREIGLTKIGIVRLIRHNLPNGMTEIRYENGRIWKGDNFRIPCSNSDYADEDGTISQTFKLSLSARDRV